VLNDVFPGADGAPAACDGIAEDWFDSPEVMQAAFTSAEGLGAAIRRRGRLTAARRGRCFGCEADTV